MMAWGIILNVLSTNPLYIARVFNDRIISKDNISASFTQFDWFKPVSKLTNAFLTFCYAPAIFLYIWVRLEEFALLHPVPSRKFFLRIILPKLFICSTYWILKVTGHIGWEIDTAFYPFTSAILFLKNVSLTGMRHIPSIVLQLLKWVFS